MPICILGMHRSGTSPITRLLQVSGLYLGPDDQIMQPLPDDNPEGYWENQLITDFNDELLSSLGGTWDEPPDAPMGWAEQPRYAAFRHRVRGLMADFDGHTDWGWKDPRNSLTLEFWLSVYPDLKLVLCLRNPLEVAGSLSTGKPMRQLTFDQALKLWEVYHERVAMVVPAERLIVTHYDTYFYDAPTELRRVTGALGMTVSDEAIERAVATLNPDLKRQMTPQQALSSGAAPAGVIQHYKAYCLQAGPVFQRMQADVEYQLRVAHAALGMLYRQHGGHSNLAHAKQEVERLSDEVVTLNTSLQATQEALALKDEEIAAVNTDRDALGAEVRRLSDEVVTLNTSLQATQEALALKDEEIAAVNTDRDTLNTRLTFLMDEVAAVQARLAAQEDELDLSRRAAEDLQALLSRGEMLAPGEHVAFEDADEGLDGLAAYEMYEEEVASLSQQLQSQIAYAQTLEADRAQKQHRLDMALRELDTLQRSLAVRVFARTAWQMRARLAPNGSRRYAVLHSGKRTLRRVLRRTPGQMERRSTPPKSVAAYSVPAAPGSAPDRGAASRVIVCTIISKNYIAYARTLMQSVSALHPDVQLVTLLVDEIDGYFDPTAEPFETLLASQLNVPSWRHFALKYDIMELNTAVKPYLLEYLFERYNAQKVIYFDPDIVLYGRLDELLALLDDHSVVLTPHLLDPLNDNFKLSELDIMRSGVYNLGFIALARTGQWRELLRWWQDKLYTGCIVDFESGYFVDQRWVDLVPGMFANVFVLRDPGYNIAYWNFKTRELRATRDGYEVNGRPLVFFHFSGFSVHDPDKVSKHQNRFVMSDLNKAYRACFADYRSRILSNGYEQSRRWPYVYGTFADGVPVSSLARRCLLAEDPYGKRWPDPFNLSGEQCFRHWLTNPSREPATRYVSPYALAIHRRRADLQVAFPYPLTADDEGLARWLVSRETDPEGEPETYHPVYIEPVKVALGLASARPAPPASAPAQAQASAVPVVKAGAAPAPHRIALPPGVNVIGYAHSETGVGQQARNMIEALEAAGVPFAVQSIATNDRSRRQDQMADRYEHGMPYSTNIFLVNADQTFEVHNALGPAVYQDRYNIGYWSWELAEFPRQWERCAQPYDELWVPSTFIQSAAAALTTKPVTMVVPVVERPVPPDLSRTDLGVPEDQFLILFMFDAFSIIERKNPWAVIKAFEQAFSRVERAHKAHLVMKVSNLEQFPREAARLHAEMQRVGGTLLASYLDRLHVNALLNSCDAYISLHRSEGYGLTLAEAMYLGKPTIGTEYSGNVDFMKPDNSYLVPFRLVELDRDYPPYPSGSVWAEPDVQAAAAILRDIYEHREKASDRAERAAAAIRQQNSAAVVGQTLSFLLERIWERTHPAPTAGLRQGRRPSARTRRPGSAAPTLAAPAAGRG